MAIFELGKELWFPPVEQSEPDGLLAVGADLSPERLHLAYRSGIFPWYNEDEPILWWSPNPRMVLYPDELKVSKSMKQVLRSGKFTVSFDTAFEHVINYCASICRNGQRDTWIVPEVKAAYIKMHQLGYAHSVEVWQNEELVGGLYGVAIGRVFSGESMFSLEANASKTGFITLVQWLQGRGFRFIDCQVHTPHLESLGAREIPRERFLIELHDALSIELTPGYWQIS